MYNKVIIILNLVNLVDRGFLTNKKIKDQILKDEIFFILLVWWVSVCTNVDVKYVVNRVDLPLSPNKIKLEELLSC